MSHSAMSPIQFGQTLPMFMTPNEIKAHVETFDRRTIHPDGTLETHGAMWARKTREANDLGYSSSAGRTLRQRIETEGIKTPPLIGHRPASTRVPARTFVSDGHHRVAVHEQIAGGDSLMPVQHYDQAAAQANEEFGMRKKQEWAAKKKPLTPMTSSDERRVNEIMTGLGFR